MGSAVTRRHGAALPRVAVVVVGTAVAVRPRTRRHDEPSRLASRRWKANGRIRMAGRQKTVAKKGGGGGGEEEEGEEEEEGKEEQKGEEEEEWEEQEGQGEEEEAFFDFPTEMDVSPSEMGVSLLCTY